jgi:hypothetical protein
VNISEPFIRRPVATTLVMAALAFVGLVAYPFLAAPLESRLIGNDRIQARIAEIMLAGAERAEITVEQVLRELINAASR